MCIDEKVEVVNVNITRADNSSRKNIKVNKLFEKSSNHNQRKKLNSVAVKS